MDFKKINAKNYLICLDRGDLIIQSLTKFCKSQKITGGFFSGIGACDQVELALYDVAKKKYFSKKFKQAFEITNITGSIGMEKDLIVHTHINLADKDMNAKGGHLVEARISGTGEIYLIKLAKQAKKYDQQTGLKIFEFDK